MSTKDELHSLVDNLPDDQALRVLAFVRELEIEEDDEPLSDETIAAIEESKAEIARGEYRIL